MSDETIYGNIRDILGPLMGKQIIDITQNDYDEASFIMLMFDDGSYLEFPIGDFGFDHNVGPDE